MWSNDRDPMMTAARRTPCASSASLLLRQRTRLREASRMLLLSSLMTASIAAAQCTKDSECKADRICEAGVCVAPPSSTSPASASPAPPQIAEAEKQAPPPTAKEREQSLGYSGSISFGAGGGYLSGAGIGSGGASVGLHGDLVRFLARSVAIAIAIDPSWTFLQYRNHSTYAHDYALGLGIRLGERHHLLVTVGPSLLLVDPGFGNALLLLASASARGVILLSEHLGLHLQAKISLDRYGLNLSGGVGLGYCW